MSTRAVAVVAVLTAFAPKMPEQCDRVLGKPPVGATSAEPAPPPPSAAPVPQPSAAFTAPPIWTPPEAVTPPGTADGGTSLGDSGATRAAYEKKDWKKVRSLLDKKLRAGTATSDELEMMREACEKLRDKSCIQAVRKASLED